MAESESRLQAEILRLLLQVAWADDQVADEEVEHILGLARRAQASDEEVATLRACLRGEQTLPPPDLGFLRDHRDQALAAVQDLIAADDRVLPDEERVLAQIREMLQA